MKKEKGAITDLLFVVVISFVLLLVMGSLLYVYTSTKPTLDTAIGSLNIDTTNTGKNLTEWWEQTWGKIGVALDNFHWIAIMLLIGYFATFLLSMFMVQSHPVFFIIYFFVSILAVVIAVPFANTYELIYTNPILNEGFIGIEGASILYSKLPLIIGALGLIGAIILFAKMIKISQEATYYG